MRWRTPRRTPSGQSMFDLLYARDLQFREFYHAANAHWIELADGQCECREFCS